MSTYTERIAAGHCGKCNQPNSNGRSLCDTCKENERQRAAAKRERNRAAGVCLNCGKPVGTRSKTKCDSCLDTQLGSQEQTRIKRKTAGICQNCGRRNAMPDKTVCKPCSNRMTDVRMKRYRHWMFVGVCRDCGAAVMEGFTQCAKCRQTDRDYKRGLKLDAFAAYGGPICVGCGCNDTNVLEMDHIGGGGNKHRREIGNGVLAAGSGTNLHRWLMNNNYPAGFRVLCPTCNKKAHKGIPLPFEQK